MAAAPLASARKLSWPTAGAALGVDDGLGELVPDGPVGDPDPDVELGAGEPEPELTWALLGSRVPHVLRIVVLQLSWACESPTVRVMQSS